MLSIMHHGNYDSHLIEEFKGEIILNLSPQ